MSVVVPFGDAVALTAALVEVDSRNPNLVPGAVGEGACAERLVEILRAWGLEAHRQLVAGDRANVIVRVGPRDVAPLVCNGHLDVVDTLGMTHAPFDPVVRDGRLYGRGSCDMKSGVAAMCAAAARAQAAGTLAREVWLTAVIDEEWQSAGTAALLAAWRAGDPAVPGPRVPPVGAIITEPTSLAICPAHKGFEWFAVTLTGRAAHGSRYDLGVDAIAHAGRVLAAYEALDRGALPTRTHPLLGRASVHASRISGGSGLSTYPESCVVEFERRTLPGETRESVLAEAQRLLDTLAADDPPFQATLTSLGGQPPSDVSPAAPLVQALTDALTTRHEAVAVRGMSAWTDAALFNAAGIPAICFGPGDIGLAHAATEYVPVDEITRATAVLEQLMATTLPHA